MAEKKITAEAVEVESKQAAEQEENENIIKFAKPYKFEGKEYSEVDLRGLDEMTIKDAVDAQAALFGQDNIAAMIITETTTAFARVLATKATGLPEEFFKYMPRGNMKKITSAIQAYINIDQDTENHIMKLRKPYMFEGKVYTEVDLNCLADMTCMNESEAENRLVRAGITITSTQFIYLYSCIMASMATGLPEEFFTGLPLYELVKLRTAVNDPDFFE